MNFRELRLEETDIPDDYLEDPQDELYWENDENSVFYLVIQDVLHKGHEAVCYALDIMPFDDEGEEWTEVMTALEHKGFETGGYGWEEYLGEYIAQENPDLAARLESDSEAETCGLYVLDSLDDYRSLLALVSTAIRELL